jgi:hypothetical protein
MEAPQLAEDAADEAFMMKVTDLPGVIDASVELMVTNVMT